MEVSQVPPGSIVVGTDGSPWSNGALDWAVDQAALEGRPLTIVHGLAPMNAQNVGLYPSGGADAARLMDDARAWEETILAAAGARALDREPGVAVHRVLSGSDPRTLLFELAEHAEMVVVGSRGRGPVASLLLGSVSVSVSRHAPCPVVVWRGRGGEATQPGHHILVGVDGTQHSLPAIAFAYRMASLRQSALTVLHCTLTAGPITLVQDDAPWPDLSAERALVAESLAGMAQTYPEVAVEVQLVSGPADHHLVAASRHHDLVVVGHQRLGHLRELIHSSVAPAVLEHVKGVVAVVPSHPQTSQPTTGT